MKRILRAAAALLLAGAMACGVSCGDKESSASGVRIDEGANARKNMTDEEYHSSYMTNFDLKPEDDENIKIMISFDNRYFGKEGTDYTEIYLIDKYFDALNNNDISGILSCYYPGYLDSLCGEDTFATPEEFAKTYRDQLAGLFGEDFKFGFIEISDCTSGGDPETENMFQNRDDTLKAAFGDAIADKITDRKLVTIGGDSYVTGGGGWAEVNQMISEGIVFCVYTIDGQPYLF